MYGHNFIINDIMDTAKKGDNAKYSNMSPEEAAFKVIHTAQYHGPLIIFDLRKVALEKLKINPEMADRVSAYISDYIGYFQQMNSFILHDDDRKSIFYASKQICEILSGKYPEIMWAAVFQRATYIPCVPKEIEARGHISGWAYAEKGYSFGMLVVNEIPLDYHRYERIISGVKNYLPEILYWVLEEMIDREMYYPPLHLQKEPYHLHLAAKDVSDAHMIIWHKLLKL